MNLQQTESGCSDTDEALELIQSHLKNTYSDTLGLKILNVREGFCRALLPVKKEFLNPIGSIHGGLLYTIADTAAGVAASSPGVPISSETVTTISGNMQFLRPCLNVDHFIVEASVIKNGKRIVFTEVKIFSSDNVLYAKADFSFARIKIN